MKIGFLKTNPPGNSEGSGVTTYLNELLPALEARGVESRVFWTAGPGAGTPRIPYQVPDGGLGRYRAVYRPNSRLMGALTEWVAAEQPDLLHCHWATDKMLALLRDLPPSFPPVVVTFHTFEPVCPLKTHVTSKGELCGEVPGAVCLREGCRSLRKWLMYDVPLRKLRNKYGSKAALYIVHNREAREFVTRAGFHPVHHIPMAVARKPISEVSPRPPVLLYVGRLRPEKGVHTIMKALDAVLQAVPQAEVRFAGTGEELQALRRSAARFGSRVKLLGSLDPEDLNREYLGARALLMPSEWKENFGLVGLEAMAFGTPVISSMAGGIQDWLRPGVNGLAFERGNPAALAERTVEILGDSDLWERLARGALATAGEFKIENHAQAMKSIYQDVLTRTR